MVFLSFGRKRYSRGARKSHRSLVGVWTRWFRRQRPEAWCRSIRMTWVVGRRDDGLGSSIGWCGQVDGWRRRALLSSDRCRLPHHRLECGVWCCWILIWLMRGWCVLQVERRPVLLGELSVLHEPRDGFFARPLAVVLPDFVEADELLGSHHHLIHVDVAFG